MTFLARCNDEREGQLLLIYMKHYLFILTLAAISFCGCSRTNYSASPSFGYDLQDSTRLIVAKFQNAPNDLLSEQATERLKSMYQACASVEVVPYDTIQNLFYRNIAYVDPIWKVDNEFLIKLYEATKARYLLVGKVVGASQGGPPISIAERYGTGQVEDIHENWTGLQFMLYDLTTGKVAFKLYTRTKAGQYNHQQGDGDVMSFYAPVNLFDKALEKSIPKLSEMCQCTI